MNYNKVEDNFFEAFEGKYVFYRLRQDILVKPFMLIFDYSDSESDDYFEMWILLVIILMVVN